MDNPLNSEDNQLSNESPTQDNDQQQDPQGQSSTGIPEKLVGKSQAELIDIYMPLEKQFHQVSSERAEEKRKREELEQRLAQLESQNIQRAPLDQEQEQGTSDPFVNL